MAALRQRAVLTRIDLAGQCAIKKKNLRTRHELREQGAEPWRWINDGALTFVGNAWRKTLEQALLEVIRIWWHGHRSGG